MSSHSVVSSSRNVRPCRGRWIGYWRTTWSTVCFSAPHSQAAEEAIPHMYKQERKRPSDTGAETVKPDPGSSWEGHSGGVYRCLELKCGVFCPLRVPLMIRPLYRTYVVVVKEANELLCSGTNGCIDLRRRATALDVRVSAEWSRCPASMAWRPRDSGSTATKLSRLDACEDWKVVRWCRTQASSHNSQGVVDDGVDEAGMSTAASRRSAVLCSRMDQG